MDIVLQGKIFSTTYSTAEQYLKLSFVENVIISTWEGESIESSNDRIQIIKSKLPERGNDKSTMNYQIVSSFEGIKQTKSSIVAKLRSDQMINNDSMVLINNFVNQSINDTNLLYSNGIKRKGNIFVLGMSSVFPFHPQDHLFWGYKEDMYRLFDIPLKPKYLDRLVDDGADFSVFLQCPIYLGAMYFSQFYPKVKDYLLKFNEYLVMNAPNNEARIFSEKTRDSVFKVLPKIKLKWTKYNWDEYPYSWYGSMGEYYHEDLK